MSERYKELTKKFQSRTVQLTDDEVIELVRDYGYDDIQKRLLAIIDKLTNYIPEEKGDIVA